MAECRKMHVTVREIRPGDRIGRAVVIKAWKSGDPSDPALNCITVLFDGWNRPREQHFEGPDYLVLIERQVFSSADVMSDLVRVLYG